MSDKKDRGGLWRQTSVVIRSDIYSKAVEMGLDFSDELNLRLAGLVGIDYNYQGLPDVPSPDPAFSLTDTTGKGDTGKRQKLHPALHPVINADDPASAAKVRRAKRQVPPDPVLMVVPDVSSMPDKDRYPVQPIPDIHTRKVTKSGESKKKGRDDVLKKFVAAKITRADTDDAVVSKDAMYEAFTRWCRDHRIVTIPDRKIFGTLLKNKFAITEKTISGTSCWMHVRLD